MIDEKESKTDGKHIAEVLWGVKISNINNVGERMTIEIPPLVVPKALEEIARREY